MMIESLSVIYEYLRRYFFEQFKAGYFIFITLMMGVLIYLSYYQWKDVGRIEHNSSIIQYFTDYFLCLIPFGASYLLQYVFYKRLTFLKNKIFLVFLFIAPATFALRMNLPIHYSITTHFPTGAEQLFMIRGLKWLCKSLFTLGALSLLHKYFLKESSFYGKSKINYKPYFYLLLCVSPFLYAVSFLPSFHAVYPRAGLIQQLGLQPGFLRVIFFELCYSFDFLSVEVFFRGFLIIGMIRICGMNAIVPAACFYCCVHLGKPMGEAISSFFGGMLLGIISYHSKSIWGGLMLHLGIAWIMEAAYL